MKSGPDALGTVENESRRAKYENGTDALSSSENESGSAKHDKRDTTPSVPLKTSLGAQNMKTRPDAHGTAENESERAKHENGTRRTRNHRKRFRVRKTCKRDPTPSVSPKDV
jgi:hypothetical protein